MRILGIVVCAAVGAVTVAVLVGVISIIVLGGYFAAGYIGNVPWPSETVSEIPHYLLISTYVGAAIGEIASFILSRNSDPVVAVDIFDHRDR